MKSRYFHFFYELPLKTVLFKNSQDFQRTLNKFMSMFYHVLPVRRGRARLRQLYRTCLPFLLLLPLQPAPLRAVTSLLGEDFDLKRCKIFNC